RPPDTVSVAAGMRCQAGWRSLPIADLHLVWIAAMRSLFAVICRSGSVAGISWSENCEGSVAGAQVAHAHIGPVSTPPPARRSSAGVVAAVLCAGLGLHPARASTVVVPDDSSTV